MYSSLVPSGGWGRRSWPTWRATADDFRAQLEINLIAPAELTPGPTATAMYEKSQVEAGRPYEPERLITPESVARAVRFVLDGSDDVHLTVVAVRPRQELV